MEISAFSLLSEGVQKAIFRLGWSELRPIQAESIRAFAGSANDLIIAARTAGGKTEAAFLPILAELERDPSKQAIYVGPLKALINDQFERLERICEDVGVVVHRWHGDVPQEAKQRFRRNPGGVLLITPESLEANFCNNGSAMPRLFGGLAFVVIDELHVFLNDVRGLHLASLLARLRNATGRNPRQIALSATLGDPREGHRFLRPDAPDTVRLIGDSVQSRDIRLGLRTTLGSGLGSFDGDQILALFESVLAEHWNRPKPLAEAPFTSIRQSVPKRPNRGMRPDHVEDAERPEQEQTNDPDRDEDSFLDRDAPEEDGEDEHGHLDDIAEEVAAAFQEGTNLIFGNSRATLEVLADKLHKIGERQHWPYDPFVVHHGSVSRDLRTEVEAQLKSGRPTTALCTSTLELGIDIGNIRAIAQIDPPWSVAALVQRLGRSGRRPGEPSILRQYVREYKPKRESSLTDALFPRLLRSIGIVELILAKWIEPRGEPRLHLSTLVHQTLSLLKQAGGLPAPKVYYTLCVVGPFRAVSAEIYQKVLRALGLHDLIEQNPNGDLMLGLKGESLVSDYHFYAAFASNEMLNVTCDGERVGELHPDFVPPKGQVCLLAGRRWEVVDIDEMDKTVVVRPTRRKAEARYPGDAGDIHTRIITEIHRILAESGFPAYLDPQSRTLLQAARLAYHRSGLDQRPIIVTPHLLRWYPWLGSRGLLTLYLFAAHSKLDVGLDALCLQLTVSEGQFVEWLETIVSSTVTPQELAAHMLVKEFDRFDSMLKDAETGDCYLLDFANGRDRLEVAEAQNAASSCLRILRGQERPTAARGLASDGSSAPFAPHE